MNRQRKELFLTPVNIFIIAIYILPFMDMLNGILIRHANFYGIGSFYHFILVLISFTIILIDGMIYSIYEIMTYVLAFVFSMSILFNYLISGNIEAISIERIEKIISTFVYISSIIKLREANKISRYKYDKIINFNVSFIPIISAFSDIIRLGNFTYSSAKTGMLGFYTGTNETPIIFTIISFINLRKIILEFNSKRVAIFIISLICLIYVQSKMSYFFAFALLFVFLIIFFRHFLNTKKYKYRFSILLIIVFGLFFISKIHLSLVDKFIARQIHQSSYFMEYGLMAYISSGRILRFKQLLLTFTTDWNIMTIIKFFIGQGAQFRYGEIFEMDYLDIFLYGGIVSSLITVIFSFKIFEEMRLSFLPKFDKATILVILFYAFFAGHVWTGGTSGIYFALLIGNCLKDSNSTSAPVQPDKKQT